MLKLLAGVTALLTLPGCIHGDAPVATFFVPPAPERPSLAPEPDAPSSTEIAYARDTARVLFRRSGGERTLRFVSADPDEGYALCLRARGSYAMLVFQRRVFEAAISQAADDVAILRQPADTAVCRAADGWTRV